MKSVKNFFEKSVGKNTTMAILLVTFAVGAVSTWRLSNTWWVAPIVLGTFGFLTFCAIGGPWLLKLFNEEINRTAH